MTAMEMIREAVTELGGKEAQVMELLYGLGEKKRTPQPVVAKLFGCARQPWRKSPPGPSESSSIPLCLNASPRHWTTQRTKSSSFRHRLSLFRLLKNGLDCDPTARFESEPSPFLSLKSFLNSVRLFWNDAPKRMRVLGPSGILSADRRRSRDRRISLGVSTNRMLPPRPGLDRGNELGLQRVVSDRKLCCLKTVLIAMFVAIKARVTELEMVIGYATMQIP
jgi:hypothetical protein